MQNIISHLDLKNPVRFENNWIKEIHQHYPNLYDHQLQEKQPLGFKDQ